ncbi:hypothetical protein [Nocardia blacklockiae]|uniref:hypothetical protein n=1 Tax=Nocardia blacklockiae TaxID=480036 RepID=UPI0018960335|nr:hypothetical protein [Nocardia blacklockiae]MBF6170591.1 hypothetical protein [Nocardia blacklockiae]
MDIPVPAGPPARPNADHTRGPVLVGLLAVADRVMELAAQLLSAPDPGGPAPGRALPATPEPPDPGWYRDRDGDIWQKTPAGWRLHLQHGVAVDSASTWDWADGHVCDYAPFVPVPTGI